MFDKISPLPGGARPFGVIENVVTKMSAANGIWNNAIATCAFKGVGTKLLQGAAPYRPNDEEFSFYEYTGFKRGVKVGFIVYTL